jgi:hypothetical protein
MISRKSPVRKSKARRKSPVRKSKARGKSPVRKSKAGRKSPVRKSKAGRKSPVRKAAVGLDTDKGAASSAVQLLEDTRHYLMENPVPGDGTRIVKLPADIKSLILDYIAANTLVEILRKLELNCEFASELDQSDFHLLDDIGNLMVDYPRPRIKLRDPFFPLCKLSTKLKIKHQRNLHALIG